MEDRVPRMVLAASAIGSALFIGVFAWLYAAGYIPAGLFLIFAIANVIFGAYALRLRSRYAPG